MNKREYLDAIRKLEGKLSKAFLSSVRSAVNDARVSEVYDGILAGDINQIARAAGVTEGQLTALTEEVRAGFLIGGLGEKAPRIAFSMRNPRAEKWLAVKSSTLIVEILETQREAVRVVLNHGQQSGVGPRELAYAIVGRKDASGIRRGGIVGLHKLSADSVTAATDELANQEYSKYLQRERRDKRFDPLIKRAMDNDKAMPIAEVRAIAGEYADNLLQLRGETIARTESIAAVAAGREQAWAQAVDEGEVDPKYIHRKWSATMGPRTRDTHAAMNGQKRRFGEPFTAPSGAQLMHPGDTTLGAPASETINCRCFEEITIDRIAQQRDRERQ